MLAEDVGKVFVYAPKDFVGIMIAVIDLRSPGGWLMDNQLVQLEWTQRTDERSAPQQDRSKQTPTTDVLDPQELAILFKHFLDTGDIVSARLLLRQAANSGNAQAALDLGMTFDPAFLAKWGAAGFTADVAQAREWYKRASNLGSTEAARRLEQLTVRK
jgi:TPR repeat protein